MYEFVRVTKGPPIAGASLTKSMARVEDQPESGEVGPTRLCATARSPLKRAMCCRIAWWPKFVPFLPAEVSFRRFHFAGSCSGPKIH